MADEYSIPLKLPEEYYVTMLLTPDIHNYMNITATVVKEQANEIYKITRTVEYKSTFGSIRDRMFAGLLAIYNYVFNTLGEEIPQDELQKGELKNYFVVAVETNNDFTHEILSFNMYFLQADTADDLIKSEEFSKIPNVDSEDYHTAIFNFGYQYSEDFKKIDIENTLFAINCKKISKDGLRRYTLPNKEQFDCHKQEHREFILNIFFGSQFADYTLAITTYKRSK